MKWKTFQFAAVLDYLRLILHTTVQNFHVDTNQLQVNRD